MQDFLVARTRCHACFVTAEQRMQKERKRKETKGKCHGAIQVMLMLAPMIVLMLQVLSAARSRKSRLFSM